MLSIESLCDDLITLFSHSPPLLDYKFYVEGRAVSGYLFSPESNLARGISFLKDGAVRWREGRGDE